MLATPSPATVCKSHYEIWCRPVLEIVVDELLEKELQFVADSVIVEQLLHYKYVVVQEMCSIVMKERIAVDNTKSGSSKMKNWKLKQSHLDTFIFLNEIYLHEVEDD
uniref:Uncharacterized protein n=1 Tax=Tanacetum cinerariifolium TaxID=118510 RepID=A0A699GLM9_TANCI|nr:hypothetical protein [Tanacetum cinerariifolium]